MGHFCSPDLRPPPPRISEKFLPYPRHKDAVKKEKRFLEEM